MPHSRETVHLPIFPIHGVLFPGMRLVLRLPSESIDPYFDELARLDRTLSVALQRAPEASQKYSLEPHLVGTTARILDLLPAAPGSRDVVLVGVSRIHVLSYRHNGKHLVGQVRYLPDLQESIPAVLVEEARALGSELASTLPREGPAANQPLPKEAETLSYWIAQNLPLESDDQQELLELRTTGTRLSKEVSHMRVILDVLRSQGHS